MAKIGFTGTHCTGKTILLNQIRWPRYHMVTQIVREFHSKGIPVNKETNELSQTLIFNKYLEILLTETNFISDRTLLDVLAYTEYAYEVTNKVNRELYEYIKGMTKKYLKTYDKLFFCPIEFPLIVDEIRDVDEEYRKYIEDKIKHYLWLWGIEYYALTGSLENKMEIFEASLK